MPDQKQKQDVKPIRLKRETVLTENDILKYEIAEELGLLDKVRDGGWKSLTARESGKIGGLMTKRMKARAQKDSEKNEEE